MSLRKFLCGVFGAAALLVTLTACPPAPPAGVVYASEGPPPMRWVAPAWHHDGHGWYSTKGEWR